MFRHALGYLVLYISVFAAWLTIGYGLAVAVTR